MPSLGDINLGGNETIEDNPANLIFCDGFNRNADASGRCAGARLADFDRRITNESGKFDRTIKRIGQRLNKSRGAADRNRLRCDVVNADGCRILHMSPRPAATRQSILVQCIGRRQQPVVLSSRDVELIARANSSCHQLMPSALKLPSG